MLQTNENVIKLVEAIARETIARLAEKEKAAANCLILVPSQLTDLAEVQSHVAGKAGNSMLTVVHSGQCDLSGFPLSAKTLDSNNAALANTLISAMDTFDEILCLQPPLSLLEKTLAADDSELFSLILIRAALRGTPVSMAVGFDHIDRKKGVFFEKVRGLIEGMQDMGFRVTYREEPVMAAITGDSDKSLITEEDVVLAHQNGSRTIKAGRNTIVTPLAQDKIRELGIVLEQA